MPGRAPARLPYRKLWPLSPRAKSGTQRPCGRVRYAGIDALVVGTISYPGTPTSYAMGLVSSTLGGCAGSCNACSSRSGTSAWWTGGCTSIASQVVDWTWHCSSAVRSKASKANRTAGENATPPRSNGLNFTAMSLEKTTNADSQTYLARFGQRNSYVPMLPGTVRPFGSCAAQEKPRACPGGGASFSIGKCAGLHPAGLLYRKSPRLSPRLSGTQRPGGWVRLEEEPRLGGDRGGAVYPFERVPGGARQSGP